VRKSWKREAIYSKERAAMQGKIYERFGEKAILEAQKRLCAKCQVSKCFLLPLTTKGEDCPYFKPKGVEK